MNVKKGMLHINVSDVDTSLKFYSEILGFKVLSNYGNQFGEVQGHGLTIGIHKSSIPSKQFDYSALSIGLEVEDLDSVISELKSKNVVFHGKILDDGPVRIAYFQDPDGNPLYLSQVKKGMW